MWIDICAETDIEEEEALGIDLSGLLDLSDREKQPENPANSMFLCRKDGQIFAYVNQCPHLHIPLEMSADQFLNMERNFVLCATHGALFQIETGECVNGPCFGESLIPVPFKIDQGRILVKLQ